MFLFCRSLPPPFPPSVMPLYFTGISGRTAEVRAVSPALSPLPLSIFPSRPADGEVTGYEDTLHIASVKSEQTKAAMVVLRTSLEKLPLSYFY